MSHFSIDSTLAKASIGQELTVVSVHAPEQMPEWANWLTEIGFIAGESVRLILRGRLGGDPLVVRVGSSTFALRSAEAACILVECSRDNALQ